MKIILCIFSSNLQTGKEISQDLVYLKKMHPLSDCSVGVNQTVAMGNIPKNRDHRVRAGVIWKYHTSYTKFGFVAVVEGDMLKPKSVLLAEIN